MPRTSRRPPVGSMSRLIIFSVVVLPQPDGPTSTVSWPSGMVRLSEPTAGRDEPGKVLETSSSRMAVAALVAHRMKYHQTDRKTATTATTTDADHDPLVDRAVGVGGQALAHPLEGPVGPGHVLGEDGEPGGDRDPARSGQGEHQHAGDEQERAERHAGQADVDRGPGLLFGVLPDPGLVLGLDGGLAEPVAGGAAPARAPPPPPSWRLEGRALSRSAFPPAPGRRRTVAGASCAGRRSGPGPRCGRPGRSP